MKIMFSGGGTLGPAAPLLAIKEIYTKYNPKAEFVWVGTNKGPERELVAKYGIPFFVIASGKLRRYFSFWNFIDIAKIIIAFFESLLLLWQEKPSVVITAGGFVSVPLHWAAWCMGVPGWVHQQDFEIGLANKLMAPVAKKVTVALRDCTSYFNEQKTEWIGNPVRDLSVPSIESAYKSFNIPVGAPVVLALGGGTGSSVINKLVLEALPSLPKEYHVIHLLGRERPRELQERAAGAFTNYHVFPFLTDEMKDAYAISCVVIARAGFATITELASLGKAAVLVPMADTHQEYNSKMLLENKAAIVLNEKTDNGLKLGKIIKDLVFSAEVRQYLGNKLHTILPPADKKKIIEIIDSLVKKGSA